MEPSAELHLLAITNQGGVNAIGSRQLQPVDPETLEPLSEYEPIDLGGFYAYALSPNRRTLAVRVQAGDQTAGNTAGALHIVDLNTWSDTVIEDMPFSGTSILRFTPDSQALFWTQASSNRYVVYRYNLETRDLAEFSTLPEQFAPSDLYISDDNRQLVAFGTPVDAAGFATDVAQLVLVDTTSGETTKSLRLNDVTGGNLQAENAEGDDFPEQHYRPGLAWDPKRELLYIADSKSDAITAVDLTGGKIQDQISLASQPSAFRRFQGWLFPSAAAVARALSTGAVALSADGKRLFAATLSERATLDRSATEQLESSPLYGIDVASGEIIDRFSLGGVQNVYNVPRSGKLLIHIFSHLYPQPFPLSESDHKIVSLDTQTGTIDAELELPGQPALAGGKTLVTDGERAYLRVFTTEGHEILMIDLPTLSIISRQLEEPTGIYELISIVGAND